MAPRIEHFVDCGTGDAVDRDFEGELPQPEPVDFKAAAREKALQRLRAFAAEDEIVADILIVLGLEG